VPAATAKVLVGTGLPSAFVPIGAASVGAAHKLADLFFLLQWGSPQDGGAAPGAGSEIGDA
jgi:hypothetical protein